MSARVCSQLMKELKTGVYSTSNRPPSEVELAAQLGVSRTVIRDALSDLEREGFIERVRGIGTVVNRDIVALNNRLDLKLEYNPLIAAAGYRPGVDSVRLRLEKADEPLAEKLELDVGDAVIVCEKRLLAGTRPVIYSVDYLPRFIFEPVDYADLDWSTPVFDLLERFCGLTVVTEIAHVRAVNQPAWVREKLDLSEEEAMLLLDETGFCKLSRPIMRSLGYYTGFFDFSMLRKKF